VSLNLGSKNGMQFKGLYKTIMVPIYNDCAGPNNNVLYFVLDFVLWLGLFVLGMFKERKKLLI
jgi:hypothetical protein